MDMKINAKPVAKPEEGTSPKKEPDKLQKLFWENRYVLLSFGGAIVVYILICIAYRMIPFGDVTILRTDRSSRSSMTGSPTAAVSPIPGRPAAAGTSSATCSTTCRAPSPSWSSCSSATRTCPWPSASSSC